MFDLFLETSCISPDAAKDMNRGKSFFQKQQSLHK